MSAGTKLRLGCDYEGAVGVPLSSVVFSSESGPNPSPSIRWLWRAATMHFSQGGCASGTKHFSDGWSLFSSTQFSFLCSFPPWESILNLEAEDLKQSTTNICSITTICCSQTFVQSKLLGCLTWNHSTIIPTLGCFHVRWSSLAVYCQETLEACLFLLDKLSAHQRSGQWLQGLGTWKCLFATQKKVEDLGICVGEKIDPEIKRNI